MVVTDPHSKFVVSVYKLLTTSSPMKGYGSYNGSCSWLLSYVLSDEGC